MMRKSMRGGERRGAVIVEAAVILPVLLVMMLGIWEVGRIIQLQQVISNSAREGARFAAAGKMNGTDVTVTMVQQTVRDYLTTAGFPTAAVSGAVISVTPITGAWAEPSQAAPLDLMRISVQIPSGPAFESLRWSFLGRLTPVTQVTGQAVWRSLNNTEVTVSTALPY
jgi:Flp pilus assembly protein TadG